MSLEKRSRPGTSPRVAGPDKPIDNSASGTTLLVLLGLFAVVVAIGVATVAYPELQTDPSAETPDGGMEQGP